MSSFPPRSQIIKDLHTSLINNNVFINHDLFTDFELALKYKLFMKKSVSNLLNSKIINKLDDKSKGSVYFILSEYYLSKKDSKLFSIYAEKSAKLNNKWGIYNRALDLWINQEYKESFNYYQKSADMKNPMAYLDVAECYYMGKGINKNIDKSIEYFVKYIQAINDMEIISFNKKYYNKIPKDIIDNILKQFHSIR